VLHEALCTAYLLLPLLGGAVLHGHCMKHDLLSCLARPIDGGRTWRGRPLFGHSKTFRGPVLVAIGSAAVFAAQQHILHRVDAIAGIELVDYAGLPPWFGAALGAAAELSELPNSLVKRQLGIAPGGTARGAASVLFYLWDQLDVLLGFWLVTASEIPVSALRVTISVAVVGTVHPLLTLAGYVLGMRPTAR
jgi:hypothetical protein